MPITYKNKSLKTPIVSSETIGDLRRKLSKELNISIHQIELRQALQEGSDPKSTKPVKYDNDANKLESYNLSATSNIEVKNLGPQFSYRGVFFVEYFGPIVLVLGVALRLPPFSFILDSKLYPAVDLVGSLQKWDAKEGTLEWNHFVQALGIVTWVLHFVKREYETFFVHKFSRPTMPLSNLYKNSTYYWTFALVVALPLCNTNFTAPGKTQVALCFAGWLVNQTINYLVHSYFASSRKIEGDKTRDVPRGPLFALVSCPNYTAEVLGWIFWSSMTQIAMGGVFAFVGLAQMTEWAISKHKGYIKSDESYKRLGRKAIIPFVL